jgi:hypothetical protein
MRRISSRWTVFTKRVFPVVWFGFLALFFVISLAGMASDRKPPIPFLLIPLAMAACGYFLMRNLIFDLADEVWDVGTELVVKNKGQQVRLPLIEISNVRYTVVTSPQRVTLTLRHPTVLGNEITFAPPAVWVPFSKHPIVESLIERIDAARRL